jgi:hypothetical protein
MSVRFTVDLLHPGEELRQISWMAKSREDWFVGPRASRHLASVIVGCLVVLIVVALGAILPLYFRLSDSARELPGLKQDLAARGADLDVLKASLGALSDEARRQVRWGDLLGALAREMPPTLKLRSIAGSRVAPSAAPGQQPGAPATFENTLRLQAVTPIRPGGQPLIETAQFMAGLMRDPSVNRRFLLKSWDIKPAGELLDISILLADRTQ